MKKKELIFILLLIVLTLPSVFPLFHHGFFQTDDGEWMIIRLSAFYQSFHDGQFPVRFLQRLNFGYGYPVAEFLYPGSFYFATLMHIIRFGFVNAIKIVYGVSLIGSAIFCYLWLSKLFSRFAGLVGALVSLYIPYHLYDVYTRGSVEVFALLWVPFVLWQIERKSIFWVAIGICLLLISHNTMALLFLPLLFIYGILRKSFALRDLIISFIAGLLVASFFIIPAIFELPETVFSQTSVSNPHLYFASFQLIGYSVLLVIVATAIAFFIKNKLFKQYKKEVIFFFIISLLAIFLSLPISSFFWNLPQASLIQFPFRVLSYFVVSISFLAAYLFSLTEKWQRWVGVLIALLVVFYSVLPYSSPKVYFDKGEGYYYTNDATTTVKDEYMPIWVKQKPLASTTQIITDGNNAIQVTNVVSKANLLSFTINLQKTTNVAINRIYWPGWVATVDGTSVPIAYNNPYGVMVIRVPNRQHTIHFTFGENPIRLLSDLVSLVAFIGLLLFVRQKKVHGK